MTRHRPEAERRAQILMAARAVFIEKGFLAARVEDVARRANLSKGAVYFYFDSKRALFDALVQEEHAQTFSFLEVAESDPRPAAVKLLMLGRQYLEYFAALRSPPRFFLLMSEMSIRDDALREQVAQIHHRFVERTEALVAEGIAEGSFRPIDPYAAAVMLKAIIDGLGGQAAIGIRQDVDRLNEGGLEFLLKGLLAPQQALQEEIDDG